VIVTDWITTSVFGPVAARGGHGLHLGHDLEALHHLAEQRVLRRQPTPERPDTMKNWLPLVFGPAFAMASEPTS
jgi:hypothetical protein